MIPTVLVPGFMCTAQVFAPQIPTLWASGPVTIASTLTGESIAQIASSLLATAPPRFALAGMSMGGYISFEMLRQAPQRIARLLLIGTSAQPDTAEQIERRQRLVCMARQESLREALTTSASAAVHPSRRTDANLIGEIVQMGLSIGVDGLVRQSEAVRGRVDSRPSLSAIQVPTLVVVGDSDALTPPDHAREIAAAVPQASLAVVRDAGHGSTLEQPAQINDLLTRWIAS